MSIESIISKIQELKDEYVSYFKPVDDADIHLYESKVPFSLPEAYLEFLRFSNGIIICGDEMLGINNQPFDLVRAYDMEHYQTAFPMPDHIVPFAPDGGGNYYCFDTSDSNRIVFWTSNYEYSATDRPEVVNHDFCDWFHEVMLEWSIDIIGSDIFKS